MGEDDIRLNRRDTEGGSANWGDTLHSPRRHPKHEHIHTVKWPRELTPPFQLWRSDIEYSAPDEVVVETLELLQAIIATVRRIDDSLTTLCDDGASELRRMQQGGDEASLHMTHYKFLTEDINGARPAYFDRLDAQRSLIDEWGDEAMPRFDEPMDECYQWVDGIYLATDTAIEAVEDAWDIRYDDGGWFNEGGWTHDPIPTDEHIDRLEQSYERFVEATYDVDLEWMVNDLYTKLETPEETNEQLGFD